MSAPRVEVGQVWRRKRDGMETRVTHVDMHWQPRRSVHHQASRYTHTEYGNFIRKYEYVRDAHPFAFGVQS